MAEKLEYWEKDENLEIIRGYRRRGISLREIANAMNIAEVTLHRWRKKSSKIADALKFGQQESIVMVENELFKKAMSGNMTAIIFYLKNNFKERYSDSPLSEEERELAKEKKRKTKADAELAELKAKAMREHGNDVATQVDKLFDTILEEVNVEDSKDEES